MEQQQELIDREKYKMLMAQKSISVKSPEQEVFEAEMAGYDEAYAAAESDLERLSILEAQKQAIVDAKKKGVVNAQKAAQEGKLLNVQQQRLAALDAELERLRVAMEHAKTDDDKIAIIDAAKDALIAAKKGSIATEETQVHTSKRAQRKAAKQAAEAAPTPHNKRGKISEKTLDSGTVK